MGDDDYPGVIGDDADWDEPVTFKDAGTAEPPNEVDLAWARGEGRCSLCINMDEDEFQAMCDCSRAYFEATGNQSSIMVIGKPETAETVFPIQVKK